MSHTGNDERRETIYMEWCNDMERRYDTMPPWWRVPSLRSQEFENHYQQLEGLEVNDD